jgi:Bacterial Ig domain
MTRMPPTTRTMKQLRMALGAACACLATACTFEIQSIAGAPDDRAPVAGDDTLSITANQPGTVDLLANDSDPDGDPLAVTGFTQGEHGGVAIAGGIATYTPDAGYIGADSFTYTVDGGGATDTASVAVVVAPGAVGCTIAAAGPATGTFGEDVRLTATAACGTGPAEVQWYHKVNSAQVIVRPYGGSTTLEIAADVVGNSQYHATVRTAGTSAAQAISNVVTVRVADNVPQCTGVKLVAPVSAQDLVAGAPQTLTASATCPAGAVPEYQFWVKPPGASSFQILPGYTTRSATWVPPSSGAWAIRAVARSVGAHVNYQVASPSVTVDVIN